MAVQPMQPMQLIAAHLELLGYQIQFDKLGSLVTHPSRPHFRMYQSDLGVVFLYSFTAGESVKSDVPGFLSFVNAINLRCLVGRFSYDEPRAVLWVSALHSNSYERTAFGTFFDQLQHEIGVLPRIISQESVTKYLT